LHQWEAITVSTSALGGSSLMRRWLSFRLTGDFSSSVVILERVK